MTDDATYANLFETTWNDASQTCEVYASVHHLIVTAEMGFTSMPQEYIVGVQRSAEKTLWQFNRKDANEKQSFPVMASFQFAKLGTGEADGGNTLAAETFAMNPDWFYVFTDRSGAQSL